MGGGMGAPMGGPEMGPPPGGPMGGGGGMPPVLELAKPMLEALQSDPSPENKQAFEAVIMAGAQILGMGGPEGGPQGSQQGPPMPQGQGQMGPMPAPMP